MVLGFIGIGMAAGGITAGVTLWCGGGLGLAVLVYSLAGAGGTLAVGLLYALRERGECKRDAPFMRGERV